MNTGQMLITIGAVFLLALVILRVNTNFFSTQSVLYNTQFGVMAVSLGTSVMEEAGSKAFDQATDTTSVSNVLNLTAAGSLGPDAGEVYPNFDDFDDFDGFSKIVSPDSASIIRFYGFGYPAYKQIDTSLKSAIYKIDCVVDYVNPTTPDVAVTSQRWHKRLRVTITSPQFHDTLSYASRDTLRMSTIFSYWYFR
ncbi:MAG: hypothetical protein AB1521_11230 [Bacteroidota bacterium]